MTSLIDLPLDIFHELAAFCGKAELLSLRLVSRPLASFFLPYADRQLALEIRPRAHYHLHRAAGISGSHEKAMVRRLLDAGAPVNQYDAAGETALHVATRHGNLNAAHVLLRAGAEVDAISAHEWTPLHLACRYGYVDIARALVVFGADVNKPGFHGWTALHYAVRGRHVNCARLLLEFGVEVDICDSDGRSALKEAKRQGWGVYSCYYVKS
uniref:Uncharacterized protein n=1 Tax=Coccidioides posadasii RMSCC 3488 TaxID=454284 RepID=A0A0J6F2K6_COCPO|nr:hypothetical protein CPAG_03437 [Coccidioides posadasii RMSCC 3488]